MPSRLLSRALALGLVLAALVAVPAAAVPVVDGEFDVPNVGTNNKLAQGSDGNIWVTLPGPANDVARITPGGEVKEFDLGVTDAQGIATGPDNFLWITRNGGVTKFSAADPEGTVAPTAIADIKQNHSIVTAPDGNLWVATSENLVRIPPSNPAESKSFAVAELSPRDVDVAGALLAIADFGGKVVTATTDDPPVTTDYVLEGGSQGVAGGPGGQFALSQQGQAPTEFGLFTPPAAPVMTPSPETDPFGVAFGPDGAYWIAQFATSSLTRLTTDNQTSALGGFDPELGPRQIAAGPGDTLWVTLEKPGEEKGKVARVSGVEAPPPAAVPISGPAPVLVPNTRIVKGPKKRVRTKRRRVRVRFKFRSPNAGARFQCALIRIRKRRGKRRVIRRPRFRGCKSPRRYRLRPGKYRFLVRAVLGGVVDPTPAKRTFRVIRKRRR